MDDRVLGEDDVEGLVGKGEGAGFDETDLDAIGEALPIDERLGRRSTGLLDITRLAELLARIRGRIVHKSLEQVSPLAVPVMLEIGREPVYGEANEALMAEAADALIEEAMSLGSSGS